MKNIYVSSFLFLFAGAIALLGADGSHQGRHPSASGEPLPKFNTQDYLFGDWLGLRQQLY